MVRVVVNREQYKITIPKDIALDRGWSNRTSIRFIEQPDSTILLKESAHGRKVVVNNGQYKITVPKEIALDKSWGRGTILRFIEQADGTLLLKEVKSGRG